jgi:hypothetical protein
MADDAPTRLLLIVTGSTLRAEELDRPLAYYLKQQVENHPIATTFEPGGLRVCVVADLLWLNDDDWQRLPTISVGGPGVNHLARHWFEELPFSLEVEEQYFIQMDPDLDELRASIWGMDNTTTQIAVSVFVRRFLPRFLERCRTDAPHLSDLDDE